jgi:hypothetical protein
MPCSYDGRGLCVPERQCCTCWERFSHAWLVQDQQQHFSAEDVQRLRAMAQALHAATAAASAGGACAAGPQSDAALAAQLDQLEADMTAFEASYRGADPATKQLLASALAGAPAPSHGSGGAPQKLDAQPTAAPTSPALRSPLGFAARPPLPPPGSLDSTQTHLVGDPEAPPPPARARPAALHAGSLANLQRSAFASPRGNGGVSPVRAASMANTPRHARRSSGGGTSPYNGPTTPVAPPSSINFDQSPCPHALFPALTPANSMAAPAASPDRCSFTDCTTSVRAAPVRSSRTVRCHKWLSRLASVMWRKLSCIHDCQV